MYSKTAIKKNYLSLLKETPEVLLALHLCINLPVFASLTGCVQLCCSALSQTNKPQERRGNAGSHNEGALFGVYHFFALGGGGHGLRIREQRLAGVPLSGDPGGGQQEKVSDRWYFFL